MEYKKKYVYALIDPRPNQSKNIYIGISNDPKKRLWSHMSYSKRIIEWYLNTGREIPKDDFWNGWNIKKSKWLYELRQNSLKPILLIIDEDERNERKWIHHFRNLGYNIMNSPHAYNCWY